MGNFRSRDDMQRNNHKGDFGEQLENRINHIVMREKLRSEAEKVVIGTEDDVFCFVRRSAIQSKGQSRKA